MVHRFFVQPSQVQGDRVVFHEAQAHQMRHVLRMAPGQRIVVLDNAGFEYIASLVTVERAMVEAEILDRRSATGEPGLRLTVFQSLLRQDKFEWVLQKGTEIGVTRFVGLITRRGLIRKASAVTENKLERWRRIVTEAAEQSHRGRIPDIAPTLDVKDAVAAIGEFDAALVAAVHGAVSLKEAICSVKADASVGLFIGPEGGFDPDEVAMLTDAGAAAIHLGPRILRTETAALVAAALIMQETGELNACVEYDP